MPLSRSLIVSVLLWAPPESKGSVLVSAALHRTKREFDARRDSHSRLRATLGGPWTRRAKELRGLKLADGSCLKGEALRGHTTSRDSPAGS